MFERAAAGFLAAIALGASLTGVAVAASRHHEAEPESEPEATPAKREQSHGAECNPYFPMPTGARWVFELSQGPGDRLRRTVEVKSAQRNGDVTRVDLEQTVDSPGQPSSAAAGRATTTVQCEDGAVVLTVKGSAAGPPGSPGGTVTARTQALPAADKLVVGYAWRSESEIETEAQGQRYPSRATRGSKVEAIEPITVPAGTFPRALRIGSVENVSLPGDPNRRMTQEIVEWYVRGLGLVKREGRIGGGPNAIKSVEQLVQYSGLTPDK